MFFSEISLSFCTVYTLQKLVVHVSLFSFGKVSRSTEGLDRDISLQSVWEVPVITTVVYVPVNTATVAFISVLFDQLLLMTLKQATEWRRLWVATCLFFLHICMKDFCTAVAFLEIISVYFPVQKHLRPLGKQNLQNRRSFTMWILAGFFHVCFVSSVSFMWLMREI